MEPAKKQNDFDNGLQQQTITELRKDNIMLKGEMDELRQAVQVLSNANEEAERKEASRKEAERKAQAESPAKPGPHHPQPPPPGTQADASLLVNLVHLDLYVRKAQFPTVDGSPPDVGGIPVKTAMDANADTRNTGFPSMFSGTGAAATEQATASTDKRKFDTADPWAEYRKKSAQYNFSDDSLCSKAPLTRMPNKTKMTAKMKGQHLRYELPKNKI